MFSAVQVRESAMNSPDTAIHATGDEHSSATNWLLSIPTCNGTFMEILATGVSCRAVIKRYNHANLSCDMKIPPLPTLLKQYDTIPKKGRISSL